MEQQDSRQEEVYLMEAGDGSLVRVPADKLEAWQRAQAEPERPLNKSEEQLIDRILRRLYGR